MCVLCAVVGAHSAVVVCSSVCVRGCCVQDGAPATYELFGLVTHLGKNTGSGHYVAHVLKDGAWTFFNDSKVVFCEKPPVDVAYMAYYRRV